MRVVLKIIQCCWWLTFRPERKQSSESSEKCLSVDGVIITRKSGPMKLIGQLANWVIVCSCTYGFRFMKDLIVKAKAISRFLRRKMNEFGSCFSSFHGSIIQRQKPVQGVQFVRNQQERRQMINTQTILSRVPWRYSTSSITNHPWRHR